MAVRVLDEMALREMGAFSKPRRNTLVTTDIHATCTLSLVKRQIAYDVTLGSGVFTEAHFTLLMADMTNDFDALLADPSINIAPIEIRSAYDEYYNIMTSSKYFSSNMKQAWQALYTKYGV